MNPITNAAATAAAATTDAKPTTTSAASKAVDKNMFLQLLVAQMRHQDPMHPQDGTQFLTQLAQFQQLESALNAGQDLAAIRSGVDQLAGKLNSSGASNV